MIDIHTHLLPGVDDGSTSIEYSVQALTAFASEGVTKLVCTPHLKASRAASAPFEAHARLLEDLRAAGPVGIELLQGWEIMLDMPGVPLTDRRLTLGGSSAILVEFQHTRLPPRSAEEIYRIRLSGLVPVIAHPERYAECTIENVEQWRSAGAVIQMDATAVLGARRMGALARDLLEGGLCDIFASDTHMDARSLAPVRDWLTEHGSSEHADLLTRANAELVLANRPPVPVPPLALETGIVHRLRDALFGSARRRGT